MINLNQIKSSILIDSTKRDDDNRGSINSIIDYESKNVSIIYTIKNSIRSNHYHLTDWHLMHVLEGSIHYFYKTINSNNIKYFLVKEGQNIFTPPNEVHATYFPENTKLIVCSKNPRDQETYENDTVRVEFINSENIELYLNKFKYNE